MKPITSNRRPFSSPKLSLAVTGTALYLLAAATPAHAGSWTLQWVCDGDFHSENWSASRTSEFTEQDVAAGPNTEPPSPPPPGGDSSPSGDPMPPLGDPNGSQHATFVSQCSWTASDYLPPDTATPLPVPSGKAMARFELHSLYTWNPTSLGDSPPSTLYVVEFGGTSVTQNFLGISAPITDVETNSVGQAKDGDPVGSVHYAGDPAEDPAPWNTAQFYSVRGVFALRVTGNTVEGPHHRFDVELTNNPAPMTGAQNRVGATAYCYMQSHILDFSLTTRPAGSSASLGNPGINYSSSTIVAAGGIADNRHQAELWLYSSFPDGALNGSPNEPSSVCPLPPSLLPNVTVYGGTGKMKDGQFAPCNASIMDPTNTWQLLGTYTSSDTTANGYGPGQAPYAPWLEAQLGGNGPNPAVLGNPGVTVNQEWDQFGIWQGSDGQNYTGSFNWDDPVALTFLPMYWVNGPTTLPITGHSMNFYISEAAVLDYDQEKGTAVLHDYSNDKIYMAMNPGLLAMPTGTGYPSLQPKTATDSGGGSYTSTLTVPSPKAIPGQIVHVTFSVLPTAEDQNAYHPN